MEVIAGIHQLKVPIPNNPLEYINAYLVQGEEGCLLVDTGWNVPEALDALERQLGEIGLGFKDIAQIVVTHIHPDHYGLAGELKRLSNARLALHQVEKELINSRYIDIDELLQKMAHWLRRNGVPEGDLPKLQDASLGARKFVSPVLPDTPLYGGEIISTGLFDFEVLWTPGHSPGHICLYEPAKKILISGDHILPTITPNISLHVQSSSNPLADYIDSLRAIKQLEVDLVLPAHEYVFNDLGQRVEQILCHHEERKTLVTEVIRHEPKTAYQIASEIPWNTKGVAWRDLVPLDKRSAVAETLAHLELLRFEGKVESIPRNSVAFYIAS